MTTNEDAADQDQEHEAAYVDRGVASQGDGERTDEEEGEDAPDAPLRKCRL
ncbi:MAG: hypothetical protein AAF957_27335 [Planctomycetota bacterium]